MDTAIEILKRVGTILANDHFVGTSGRHFDCYINKDALYPHTEETSQIGKLFAEKYKDLDIDAVAGPALGGIILSQWTAHHLSKIKGREILGVYAEKEDEKLTFFTRRGYHKLISGKKVLAIEDLTQTGGSLKKLVEAIKESGGEVVAASVMVNKDPENINSQMFGVPFSALSEMPVKTYDAQDCILCKNNVPINKEIGHGKEFLAEKNMNNPSLTYGQRANLTNNPTAKKLFNLMQEKQTNLCVAADLTKKYELLQLAESVGPEICVLKTHIDIVEDFDPALVYQLQKLSERHNFLIFEDRKFADTGNTVKMQYEKGIYKIADWAHIVNAHSVAGPGIILGLKEVGMPRESGLLMLAEMSSRGTLAQGEYTEKTLQMAQDNKDFVIGFITMEKIVDDPAFINMTPGVKLQTGTDNLGQQFKTPDLVIRQCESDIIIVGRGIYRADNPTEEARKYRKAGWEAYKKRL